MASGADKGFVVIMAVDNSTHSEYAFNYYVKEVHRPGHKVQIIHCSEAWMHCHHLKENPTEGHVQEMKSKEETKVEEIESKFTKLLKDHNIEGGFEVIGGKDTWHQIIQYQEKNAGQLIVVGTRGSNVIRRTLLGSVSDSIVHHAHCPVLVCRHEK